MRGRRDDCRCGRNLRGSQCSRYEDCSRLNQKMKPVVDKKGLDKKIQVASIADDPVPAEETNFEKLMAGSDDVPTPDPKVLEAKIAETVPRNT